jgi:hypothetical protein
MNAMLRRVNIFFCAAALAASACAEADAESEPASTAGESSVPMAQQTTVDYFLPDRKAAALSYESGSYIFKPIIAIVGDVTPFR